MADTPRSWIMQVYPPGKVMSVNDDHRRGHWATSRHRAVVRRQAKLLARDGHVAALPRARVTITVHLRNWRQADATNYAGGATVKAVLDGLVDAGVAPSDRPEHLDVAMPVLAGLDGQQPRVVLIITEVLDGEAR